jgi:signal transduction histidine kinase
MQALFGSDGFMPHGHCYLWRPGLVWLHLVSDGLITLAYYSIPVMLVYFVRNRRDAPFHWMFLMFGAFIVACGTTHLMEIWTLWVPSYWASGAVKAATAALSVGTAVLLAPLIPKALALPSPAALQAANDTLALEVAERQRAQEALASYVEELAHSNQELDDFAYVASHDLKEPLRGIGAYASILATDYAAQFEGDALAKLEMLPRLTKRMEELIDSLLRCARVGRADLSTRTTDLNVLVAEVIESLRPWLQEHGADVRIPVTLPSVECDPVLMREVFQNLVTNAVKYNDKPTRVVEIGWRPRPAPDGSPERAAPTFYVRDDGIGIRPQHQETIFRLFKRLHGRDKFGGGMGAGLTIARRIVERHRGRIWVESTYGAGATFFFTLGDDDHGEDGPTDLVGGRQPVGLRAGGTRLASRGAGEPDLSL